MQITVDNQPSRVVLDGLLSIVRPAPDRFTAQVIVLGFSAVELDVKPVPAPQATSGRRRFVEGLDASALTSVVEEAMAEAGPLADEPLPRLVAGTGPDLPTFVQDWEVGWMGVEG
jgi:hypothetical protein